MATLATLTNVLKTAYLGPISDLLENEVLLYRVHEKDTESVSGKNLTIPVRTQRNPMVGARADGGTLPTLTDVTQFTETIVPMRYNYGRFRITGPTIRATRNNEGAFARGMDVEMQALVRDVTKQANRQMFGTGQGILALVNGTPATTLPVDTQWGGATGGTVLMGGTAAGNSLFYINQRIQLHSAITGGTTRTGAAVVSAVSADGLNVTIDAVPTGAADNDFITTFGSRGVEVMGLLGMINNQSQTIYFQTPAQTYQSIDASSGAWNGNVRQNSGTTRALTRALMQRVIDDCERVGGGRVTHIWCSYGMRLAYFDLLSADLRYQEPTEFEGGFSAITHDDVPLIADADCPLQMIFFEDSTVNKIYTQSDGIFWMGEDNAILNRVPNEDAYEATLGWYFEFGTSKRNAHGVLRDLTEG